MKKSIALIMILAMMMAIGVETPATTIDGSGKQSSHEVRASYEDQTRNRTIISVDISWENMSFTYKGPSEPVWNAETHRYEARGEEGWGSECATITICNNSNAILRSSIRYDQEENFESVDMRFTDHAPYIGSADTGDKVDEEGNTFGTPCRIVIKAIPVGTLDEQTKDSAKIGTISITVDANVDPLEMLDELDERISVYELLKPEGLTRGAVCFASGTDTQNLLTLTAAAAAACTDEELSAAQKNVAINKALAAFYSALDLVR